MEAEKIVDIIADKVDLRSLAGTLTIIFFTLRVKHFSNLAKN